MTILKEDTIKEETGIESIGNIADNDGGRTDMKEGTEEMNKKLNIDDIEIVSSNLDVNNEADRFQNNDDDLDEFNFDNIDSFENHEEL